MMKVRYFLFCLTSRNVDDRNEAVMVALTKEIFGKLFADRGYISQKLFKKRYYTCHKGKEKYEKQAYVFIRQTDAPQTCCN